MTDLKIVSKSQQKRLDIQRKKKVKKDLVADTIIHILVDASGSMLGITDATIEGVNSFISKQREDKEGTVLVTLTMFDSEFDMEAGGARGWNSPQKLRLVRPYEVLVLGDVPVLDREVYKADGGTPLRDGLGHSIQHTDGILERVKTKNPDVLFLVVTDGGENTSQEFTAPHIKEMIEQREKQGWTFVYMGADHDSWAETANLGFQYSNVRNYAKADVAEDAFGNLAVATTAYRATSRTAKAQGLVGSYTTSSFFADAGITEDATDESK